MSTNVHAQQQRVEVQLSANRVSIDESVVLSVRAYSIDADIDASGLDKNFDVTKRSSSRQITIENGKRTSVVEWMLELIPRRTGALEIVPIKVGSEQSRPLTLLVEESASGSNRDLFLLSSVDVSNPYVQAEVIYTLKVYQDVRFLDASLSMPNIEGAVMQQIGEERNYQETVEGRNYTVSEIKYSIFPQQSGKLDIPSVALKAVVQVNRNQVPNTRTRTRTLTRRADNIELNVKPRPDGLAGNWWLPAKEITLQERWSASTNDLVVDQPITRTINMLAVGAIDTQLPQIEIPDISNISIYADSPNAQTESNGSGLVSQQTNTWAIIPQVAGELVLPEVRVNWFDTVAGEPRVAVLPEQRLMVKATESALSVNSSSNADGIGEQSNESDAVQNNNAALSNQTPGALTDGGVNTASSSGQDIGNSFINNDVIANAVLEKQRWKRIALALLAAWLLSLLGLWAWWRSKFHKQTGSQTAQPTDVETAAQRFHRRAGSKAALEPIKLACASGDASKISQKILAWGAMVWPSAPPTHINDVANRLQDERLTALFNALDAQQYQQNGSVKTVAVEAIPAMLKTAVEQYQESDEETESPHALPTL